MPEYPGRNRLRADSREGAATGDPADARAVLAALDHQAHDLDALARRLDDIEARPQAEDPTGPRPVPSWVEEATPCAACPPEYAQEHDDNGHEDADGARHPGHAFEPMPVHAVRVTFYVAAWPAPDGAADVVEAFERVLEHSTAREALADGMDGAGAILLGADRPELADALDPEGTDPAAWPMLQLPPVVAAIVAEWADTNRGTWPAPDPAAALDLVDEPHRSDYGARIIEAARAALGLAVNDGVTS